MGSPEWVGNHYEKWLGPKFGEIVLSGGGKDEIDDAARFIAALIEPEPERTCRMIDNGCELCCSECDRRHQYDDEPNYCMGCGARVVDE